MQPQSPASKFEKIRSVISHDPKRNGLLAGLGIIMLVLWGRLLLNGPASATASLIRRSVAAISEPPIPTSHASTSNPVLDWLGKPRGIVDRNLFAIHLDYYARADDRKSIADGNDDATTTPTAEADQKREQQILLENLQTQAAKLKLQTTLMGDTPRAMVNGQLVQAGDAVEGFKVVKIEARQIVVQQDGVTLEISMP